MITEILKIIPQIDKSRLGKLVVDLSSRFERVASIFGKGLEKVLKGNILFLSLGFLTQLLNPLEKVHDKIKSLLSQGSDIRDVAERFNTDSSNIFRLQALGQSFGVKPEELLELMGKYADAIDKAREEIADPTKELSASTQAVQQFVGEDDMAEGFFKFLQSLRARGESGEGQDIFLAERDQRRVAAGEVISESEREGLRRQGLVRRLTAEQVKERTEEAVFGESASGGFRRLINADLIKAADAIGLGRNAPGVYRDASESKNGIAIDFDPVKTALDYYAKLEDQRRVIEARNMVNDTVVSSGFLTPEIVAGIEEAAERQRERELVDLSNITDLQRAAKGIDDIKELLSNVSTQSVKLIGFLGTQVPRLMTALEDISATLKASRFLRNVLPGGDK